MGEKKPNKYRAVTGEERAVTAGGCLNPVRMRNKATGRNISNGGIPRIEEEVFRYINIPCGWCAICRRKKRSEWMVRLMEEIKNGGHCDFITLTFSEEALEKYYKMGVTGANSIAICAVKEWREKINKRRGEAIKHFIIPETGTRFTKRLHLHGIVWTKDKAETWKYVRLWQKGRVDVGYKCDASTASYVTKYITKGTEEEWKPKLMVSPGIGKAYLENPDVWIRHRYMGVNTDTTYSVGNGQIVGLPGYYKRKLFTIGERRERWRMSEYEPEVRMDSRVFKKTDIRGIGHYMEAARLLDRRKWQPEGEVEARLGAKKIMEEQIREVWGRKGVLEWKEKEWVKSAREMAREEKRYEEIREWRYTTKLDVDRHGEIITNQQVECGRKINIEEIETFRRKKRILDERGREINRDWNSFKYPPKDKEYGKMGFDQEKGKGNAQQAGNYCLRLWD